MLCRFRCGPLPAPPQFYSSLPLLLSPHLLHLELLVPQLDELFYDGGLEEIAQCTLYEWVGEYATQILKMQSLRRCSIRRWYAATPPPPGKEFGKVE